MDEILTPEQWHELQFRLKTQYPQLTDTDLPYYEAHEEDMLEMIAYTLQNTKDLMKGVIDQYHLPPLKNYWRYNRKSRTRQQTAC